MPDFTTGMTGKPAQKIWRPSILCSLSTNEFKIEAFEKSIAYLPAWEGADDDFTGLFDNVTIRC